MSEFKRKIIKNFYSYYNLILLKNYLFILMVENIFKFYFLIINLFIKHLNYEKRHISQIKTH